MRAVIVLVIGAVLCRCKTGALVHAKETLQSIANNLKEETKHLEMLASELAKMSLEIENKGAAAASAPPRTADQFVAVFDGGSTGTRLNIYQFDPKGLKLKAHLLRNIMPGIHTSKSPESDIKQLLEKGREFLEKRRGSKKYAFPVVFNGTAGLRLIDLNKKTSILSAVKNVLAEETGNSDVEVRVIDGKEEGFYAWAALVFVTQIKEKIGIIDLGGGSAQISFEIDKDGLRDKLDGVVSGKNKSVLTRSFLGMGLNAGVERVHAEDKEKVCLWKSSTFSVTPCKTHIKNTISAMILERTKGQEAAPGISQVNTVFVSSFIAEILQMLQIPEDAKFQDIKNRVDTSCSKHTKMPLADGQSQSNPLINNPTLAKAPDCISIMYAIMFMESLGVGLFTPIENAASIRTDITWSLGRALSLIE